MFYCMDKKFPRLLVKSADQNSVTCVDLLDDAQMFETRKKAEAFLKSVGQSGSFDVINENAIFVEVYEGKRNVTCGYFDSTTDCRKFLLENGYLWEGKKVSFSKGKISQNVTIATIS